MSTRKSPMSSSALWIFMLLLIFVIMLMVWLMVRGDGSSVSEQEVQTTPISGGGSIPTDTPAPEEPTEVPPPANLELGQNAVVVTIGSASARLHLNPSKDAPTLDVYQSGVRVMVMEPTSGFDGYPVELDGEKWYRVRIEDGLAGWMLSENLVLNEE